MAVDNTDTYSGPYTTNGATTVFPFTFKAMAGSEVSVSLISGDGAASVVNPSAYTVTLGADAGGNVTFAVAPATGSQLYIDSNPSFEQLIQFTDGDRYSAKAVNEANDRAAIRALKVKSFADRTFRVPRGESGGEIPKASSRAGKVAVFTDAGSGAGLGVVDLTASQLAGLAGQDAAIGVLAANISSVLAVNGSLANINSLSGYLVQIAAVASDLTNLNAVASNLTNINTVAGVAGNVTIVAGVSSSVSTTAANIGAVGTVATDLALGAGSSYILRAPQAAIDAVNAASVLGDAVKRSPGWGGVSIMQDVAIAPNTLDLREMGRFNQRDNAFIASDVMTTAQQVNKRRVYTYGHSGFEGTGVTNDQETDPYISQRIFIQRRTVAGKLGTKLGSDWEVFNHGISTQKIEGIAGRFGALPIRVSVTGGSIPASGTVSCTYCAPNPIYPNRSGMMIYGTINGSPVRLTNPSGTVFLEQPPGAAGALTVADLSIFVPTTSGSEYAICMFWLDRNNQNVEATKHIAGQILARMRKVGNDRCIFWGDWPLYTIVTAGQSTIGTTDYINTIAINDYYRTAFPGNFFDIYRFLREDFPYDGTLGPKASTLAGITLTTGAGDTDQTRIANGFIPKSYVDVSNSGDHFNDTGYDTLAQGAIEYFFKPRGWLN